MWHAPILGLVMTSRNNDVRLFRILITGTAVAPLLSPISYYSRKVVLSGGAPAVPLRAAVAVR